MFITALHMELTEYACRMYPKEACGLIVDGKFIPSTNLSQDPRTAFEMDPSLLIEYDGRIEYIFHSHPQGGAEDELECPSAWDMRQQMATNIPWMIVPVFLRTMGRHSAPVCGKIFTFGEKKRPPLLGRAFRHGVTDCYSLARDAYAAGEIPGLAEKIQPHQLPEVPREWGWWREPGVALYENLFKENGFEIIGEDVELRPWDGLLCAVGSPSGTPNHAILYLGNNQGLHHVGSWRAAYDPSRLSCRENVSRWIDTVRFRVRPKWAVPSV